MNKHKQIELIVDADAVESAMEDAGFEGRDMCTEDALECLVAWESEIEERFDRFIVGFLADKVDGCAAAKLTPRYCAMCHNHIPRENARRFAVKYTRKDIISGTKTPSFAYFCNLCWSSVAAYITG